jgi:hypothetical protein
MIKITLLDGQEFTGEMVGEVESPWIHVDLPNERVYFPQHRIVDVRVWWFKFR